MQFGVLRLIKSGKRGNSLPLYLRAICPIQPLKKYPIWGLAFEVIVGNLAN